MKSHARWTRPHAAALAALALCLLAPPTLHAGPPQYTFVEVTPRPLRLWNAYDIGPQGQVVGRTYDLNVSPALSRGFVWHNGTMTLLDGPDGETITEARCIDDNGVVYGGYADRRFDTRFLKMNPVRWVDGKPIPYPNNQQVNSSTIFSASPTSGVAVGWAKPFEPGAPGWRGEFGYANEMDFDVGDPVRAFRWNAEGGSTLTMLLGVHDDLAVDINDTGQAAIQLHSHELGGAAIFDPRLGVVRLPGLGVSEYGTRAWAINESGQIVGHAMASGGFEHPVCWHNGRITDLGLLPGYVEGEAMDINNAGVIVGGLANVANEFSVITTLGIVVIDGTMYNVNDLVPAGGGGAAFVIKEAAAINSAGQILVSSEPIESASGRFGVLTPIP